ncbi:unnamed protein product [Larinioides sclopetarius]|uniref:Endonuclease/exonuclease/phosphatase domain-containing protein n=1 Tax=Larinioides sclopetarius TaxID=280406 RepID=A0AAV2BVV6_9ARAC
MMWLIASQKYDKGIFTFQRMNPNELKNRKGFFSLNGQTLSNADWCIRNIVARWPGSDHDNTIFEHSSLRAKFESGAIPPKYHLVGDNGCGCSTYMLAPFLNPRTQSKRRSCFFNINGISTSATRIKLDQILELALTEGVQIIALQETKLKLRISLKSLPLDLQDIFTVGTVCLGDLNAKHPIWGSSTANPRGNELLNIIDARSFTILNDVPTSKVKQWIFRKADWHSFAEVVGNEIKSKPLCASVEKNWCSFKDMIIRAAKKSIPRGNLKKKKHYLTSKSPLLQPLLEERKRIFENKDTSNGILVRIKMNKINAKIKRLYAQDKQDKWNELCSGLDSRTSNGKLWKLVRNIGREQPQVEQCNTIQSEDGKMAENDEQAANLLGLHYQDISKLNFTVEDRIVKRSKNFEICTNCSSEQASPHHILECLGLTNKI